MRFLCALATFILLSLASEPILAAERLTLLDTLPEPDSSSNPANFKRVGNLLFFNANGSEIWVTDGTEAGTRKTSFTGTIDDTYYASDTALYRYKVSTAYAMPSLVEYKDGPEGPLQATLVEIQTNAASAPKSIIEYKDEVYFCANVGAAMGYPESGIELVACKRGEPDTFRRVADTYAGTGSSSPMYFTLCDGLLFFSAMQSIYKGGVFPPIYEDERRLFSTNGTSVSQIGDYYFPFNITATDDVLYFLAGYSALYKRTPVTGLISQISSWAEELTGRGKGAFFVKGDAIWWTDGISSAATRICDADPSSTSEEAQNLTVVGENLFFTVDGPQGRELWRVDSANQASLLKDISLGADSTEFLTMGEANGTLFLYCRTNVERLELWRSDGTPNGTVRVKVIGYGNYTQHWSGSVNGKFVFRSNDPLNGVEPYKSDGTETGTGLLKNIGTAASSVVSNLSGLGMSHNRVYLSRSISVYLHSSITSDEFYLYEEDGSPGGLRILGGGSPVEPLYQRLQNNRVSSSIAIDNHLICSMGNRVQSFNIAEQTPEILLYKYLPNHLPPNVIKPFVEIVNGKAYFCRLYNQLPVISNGTSPGTKFLDNYAFNAVGDSSPRILGILGENVLFQGSSQTSGTDGELYKSNGTAAGTKLVKDINPGSASSDPKNGQMAGNIVYFQVTTPEAGAELWRTNGYESGTKLVEDIVPGTGSSNPFCLGATDADVMIFAANGNELWRSNGNAAGTYMLKDTLEGTTNRLFEYVGTHLGKVYISARTPNELWVSDGTVAGTKKIADTSGRYVGFIGNYLFVANSSNQICATDGSALALISTNTSQGVFSDKYFYQCIGQSEQGTTFLRSDGTTEGTQQFTAPSDGSSPVLLGILDGQLIYSVATTLPNAQQIWSYDLREDSVVHEWMIYQ